ncbi:Di-sulfide bridge nucleocytoplasmic transport domain-containing protein [Radiomyces spectabilis]|uniref:Di-sulfide bridge nucleocytoplasmic transport domain-containing protein n=1 Tax=Radiomyces spectabilis TaxID=64574 RepID=UPI002221175F|nr:Di-sulfide bridge nucleocytoplasmic transport domain-containing protein [Radiomyces spectabilis]KAI8390953.1 Di-sulfide bridge nucleocytoplasmic transport domain-containing protein [Radiomyces spectabilis]
MKTSDACPATITGIKRSCDDEANIFIPPDYKFKFIPSLPSNKKHKESSAHSRVYYNALTLTERFRRRLKLQTQPIHRTAFAQTLSPTTSLSPTVSTKSNVHYASSSSIIERPFTILYVLLKVILTVRKDFEIKAQQQSAEILRSITQCAAEYRRNHCDPATRVPYMEEACNKWQACMDRDHMIVARAKVSAETIAEIINSFVEPISYKTMVTGSCVIISLKPETKRLSVATRSFFS